MSEVEISRSQMRLSSLFFLLSFFEFIDLTFASRKRKNANDNDKENFKIENIQSVPSKRQKLVPEKETLSKTKRNSPNDAIDKTTIACASLIQLAEAAANQPRIIVVPSEASTNLKRPRDAPFASESIDEFVVNSSRTGYSERFDVSTRADPRIDSDSREPERSSDQDPSVAVDTEISEPYFKYVLNVCEGYSLISKLMELSDTDAPSKLDETSLPVKLHALAFAFIFNKERVFDMLMARPADLNQSRYDECLSNYLVFL